MELLSRIFRVEGILESGTGDCFAHLTPDGIAIQTKPEEVQVVSNELRRVFGDLSVQIEPIANISGQDS